MKILARALVLSSALALAACHEDATGPQTLSGDWSGSSEGRTLQLNLTYSSETGSWYGVPVETRSLRYTGSFSDATLGYSGPVDEAMGIGTDVDLHPLTLQYLAYIVTDTAAYSVFYKGEQTGAREITGWLYFGAIPLSENPIVTLDSIRLVLRRS